jgi:hypothetical protein
MVGSRVVQRMGAPRTPQELNAKANGVIEAVRVLNHMITPGLGSAKQSRQDIQAVRHGRRVRFLPSERRQ